MYIITTKDRSHSLFSEEYDEIYHSGNGAIQESTHVFIKSGFDYALQNLLGEPALGNTLKIFEVGFGTGLNALLTVIATQKQGANEDSLLDFQLPQGVFHLIYFDAFAPENQPEMWTVDVMKKLYQSLQPHGILVSYCSKSAFRKVLIEAGFEVEKLQGPPGKREMVRAHKRMTN